MIPFMYDKTLANQQRNENPCTREVSSAKQAKSELNSAQEQ